jgi:hypothetical protein
MDCIYVVVRDRICIMRIVVELLYTVAVKSKQPVGCPKPDVSIRILSMTGDVALIHPLLGGKAFENELLILCIYACACDQTKQKGDEQIM